MKKETKFQPDDSDCARAWCLLFPGLNLIEIARRTISGEGDELSARPSRALDKIASQEADSIADTWERERSDDETHLEVKIEAEGIEVTYSYSVEDDD